MNNVAASGALGMETLNLLGANPAEGSTAATVAAGGNGANDFLLMMQNAGGQTGSRGPQAYSRNKPPGHVGPHHASLTRNAGERSPAQRPATSLFPGQPNGVPVGGHKAESAENMSTKSERAGNTGGATSSQRSHASGVSTGATQITSTGTEKRATKTSTRKRAARSGSRRKANSQPGGSPSTGRRTQSAAQATQAAGTGGSTENGNNGASAATRKSPKRNSAAAKAAAAAAAAAAADGKNQPTGGPPATNTAPKKGRGKGAGSRGAPNAKSTSVQPNAKNSSNAKAQAQAPVPQDKAANKDAAISAEEFNLTAFGTEPHTQFLEQAPGYPGLLPEDIPFGAGGAPLQPTNAGQVGFDGILGFDVAGGNAFDDANTDFNHLPT